MSRSAVADLLSGAIPVETPVTLAGWLRSRRSSKGGFSFLAVHDGSAFDAIQVVADQALPNYEAIAALGPGCAVEIEGTLVASQGKGQSVEVVASAVTILGEVDDPATYPVPKKGHTFEYLRTVAHHRPRANTLDAQARHFALSRKFLLNKHSRFEICGL